MKQYFEYLQKSKLQVKYINFNESFNINKYILFDPIDKIKLNGQYTLLDSPNFLLTSDLIQKYRKKTTKFFFYAFYMWSKNELNIMPGIKSQDSENRLKLPNINIPKSFASTFTNTKTNTNKSILFKESVNYINNHFTNNHGNTGNFNWPTTHKEAKQQLTYFITTKFKLFGSYQDSISKDNSTLFHSLLSSSINIGLLQPLDIIKLLIKSSNKNNIPLNSLEGFVRQLFWREYQRLCYLYCDFTSKNYFGNTGKLESKWYTGIGIEPVDRCIQNAFEYGYLHHIERLMIVGNYMNLSGISPQEGFRWFMEFSCDSYEWVMHQNVYEMVFFVTGGLTMRRPYMSSSNYILKMSNYSRSEWSDKWDELYHTFIKKHKNKLNKFFIRRNMVQ
jgi:deoxyribodipyrimidine photolyase-related protein